MSTITLYKNLNILEEKNYIIEDIETFLNNLIIGTKLTFTNAQYIKQGLNAEAKVKMNQDELDKVKTNTYNYCSIKNDNGDVYYYFVRERQWTSKECVKFVLRMDVLNSFEGKYQFNAKTEIFREHCNRWEKTEKLTQPVYLQSKVDNVTEEFGELAKILKSSNTIYEDENNPNNKWYLVYRTPDLPTPASPVDVFLVPNFEYKIGTGSSTEVTLTKEYFAPGFTYYITKKDNPHISVRIRDGSVTKYLQDTPLQSGRYMSFVIHRETTGDQKLTVTGIQYNSSNTVSSGLAVDTTWVTTDVESIQLNNAQYLRRNEGETPQSIDADFDKIQNQYEQIRITGLTGENIYSQTIDDIDRTDTRILKIIECPYCPINIDSDYDKYTIDLSSRFIKINYKAELYNAPKTINVANYVALNKYVDNISIDAPRYLKDSKLLHSSITELKCVYDSYAKIFALENCSKTIAHLTTTPESYEVLINYKQANTITSSLAFKFECLYWNESGDSDYYQYLVSSRNNEIPLYHNEYLNYMRTDYNYARKSQQLSMVNSIFNTATATVGGVIGGAATGGVAGAIVGGVTAFGKGLQSTITQGIQLANNIEQTQLNKRMAATGVSGSDDLNLFKYYSENKIIVKVYQPKDYIMQKLDDLFHYCGYKRNYQGIPNLNSRTWFNYLQCNPSFNETSLTAKMGLDCKNELIRKFNEGVTKLHKVNVPQFALPLWDFGQNNENWEIELMN